MEHISINGHNVLSSQSTHGFLPNLKILEYNGMLRLPEEI